MVNARTGLELVAPYRALRGDQQRRGGIADLAGHGRSDAAAGGQRLERRHLLERGAHARRLILLQAVDGGCFAREETAPNGLERAAVALERELLHLPAGDIPLRGDHFGCAELRHLLGAIALAPTEETTEGVRVTE